VNHEKRPSQSWTASVSCLRDQPDSRDRGDEDGNSQDLGQVWWSAAHQQAAITTRLPVTWAVNSPRLKYPITSTLPAITLSKVGALAVVALM